MRMSRTPRSRPTLQPARLKTRHIVLTSQTQKFTSKTTPTFPSNTISASLGRAGRAFSRPCNRVRKESRRGAQLQRLADEAQH